MTSQDQLSSFTEAELRSRTWNYLQYLNTKLYLFEGVHIPQESSFDVSYPLSIPDSEWDDWRQVPRPPPPAATNQRPKFPILRRQFATLSQYLLRRAPDLSIDNATTLLAALNDQLQRTYYEAFDQAQTIQRFEALCVRIWQERLALSLDATHITYGRRSGDEAEKEFACPPFVYHGPVADTLQTVQSRYNPPLGPRTCRSRGTIFWLYVPLSHGSRLLRYYRSIAQRPEAFASAAI